MQKSLIRILTGAGVIIFLFLYWLGPSFKGMAAPRPFLPPRPPNQASFGDRVLVKFFSNVPQDQIDKVHRENGGRVVEFIPELGVQVVEVPQGQAAEKAASYSRNPHVEFAEPDYIARAVFIPNDPYFAKQWGMTQIQGPEAWDLSTGDKGVAIAILDTGIDQDHEDLAGQVVANVNFSNSRTVDDRFGHGTHVAGIASAVTNNALGVAGLGYRTVLFNVKVLGDEGQGFYSWVARGILWAAENGAKVINLSLGGTRPSKVLERAVDFAWSKGVIIVAAAGNDNTSSPFYPAAYPKCMAVAATDQEDTRAFFSNYGSWVDIAAPGVDIFSTTPNHDNYIHQYGIALGYDYLSGTSMASPHVAGTAALVWARYPYLKNGEVRWRIERAVDPTTGFDTPVGRVNAYRALQ
ncbi:thermitase [Thermanaeromonas toyohensis ToBE]|uniref:Thermitase n=1 Tax=Thermanaeromonas toyohensis ToBE TaxID=698762 RepID=A0A1W1W321_9FIRM|nr:S8 family peptidase [Thermanaeromonas toyohensis]SMC00015.1 thermitase [Thermanaeromonas toyohensis ToBE]